MTRKTTAMLALLIAATAGGAVLASETLSYSYDAKGRLVKVARSGTVNNGVLANYSFDKADNRVLLNVTGAP